MSRPFAHLFLVTFLALPARGGLVGQYTFETTEASSDPLIVDFTPDVSPSGLGIPMARMINGASYANANSFGSSSIGNALGTSGRVVSSTSGSNNFAFWVNKDVLSTSSDWTISLWANREGAANGDALFYIGTSDALGGGSAETYVIAFPDGSLLAENYTSASTSSKDMSIDTGTTSYLSPGTWHLITAVREGTGFSLYADGQLVGNDPDVAINSLSAPGNSVIVFGGVKSLSNSANRVRLLDGLIDNVSIYNHALTGAEIAAQYQAIAVPEASSLSLAAIAAVSGLVALRKSRSRRPC